VERHAHTLADTDPAGLLSDVARPDIVGLNYQAIAAAAAHDAEQLAPLSWHCHMYDLAASGHRQPLGTSRQVDVQLAALRAAGYIGDLMVEFATGAGERVGLLARDVAYLRSRVA
jgi:hypothetical protein